jgi:retron-type reverse transcriptase
MAIAWNFGVDFSAWKNIYKGVPQGSILGPVLFNIFFNDIFNFVEESILYNYADDNTLSYSDTELNKVVDILEKESLNLIHWFVNLPNFVKCLPICFNTFNCLEAFLHIFEI